MKAIILARVSKGDVLGFVSDLEKIENIIAQNAQLQNCRKEVTLHPEKYPKDWEESPSGTPYYSAVDQPTKDFMLGIINRLK